MENVGKSLTPFHFRKTKTNPEGGGILIANQWSQIADIIEFCIKIIEPDE